VEVEICPEPTEAERAAIMAALAEEEAQSPNLVLSASAEMFGNRNVFVCGVTTRTGAPL
jgi:hypothetical protein